MNTTRERELALFERTWIGKSRQQVIEEFASLSLETKRIPDPYFYVFSNGALVSPTTNRPVEDSIEKTSYLGKLEFEAFGKIEKWVGENSSGVVFWFSPPHQERSGQTKIIASVIEEMEGQRILFNHSILLDIDAGQTQRLAFKLTPYLTNSISSISTDSLRSQPLFLRQGLEDNWLEILEQNVADSESWDYIKSGRSETEKEKALSEGEIYYDGVIAPKGFDDERTRGAYFKNASKRGVFGDNPTSCPPNPTAFEHVFNHSEKSKLVKKCGNCGIYINKFIAKGFVCSHCGGTFLGC